MFQFGETVLSKKENITTIYLLYLGHNGCTLIIKYYMSGIYNNMINTNSWDVILASKMKVNNSDMINYTNSWDVIWASKMKVNNSVISPWTTDTVNAN